MIIDKNYPLKKITTIGLGGCCKEYVCPSSIDELKEIIVDRNPLFIGNGSNTCFITDYYNRTVVNLKKMKKNISFDKNYIYCSSNISCTKLARHLHNNQISGFEFLYGIPGTLGGAIYMNAGAFDKEIMPYVYSVDLINQGGQAYTLYNKDLNYSYRSSNIDKTSIITSAKFFNHALSFDDKLLDKLDVKRKKNQPTNQLSCGCIFKNPNDDYASRLIETSNLKGVRVGGIYVSTKHSNYFINDGSGTFKDFLLLLKKVKDTVFKKHKIQLTEEVILVK